jgi:hypothetical protein
VLMKELQSRRRQNDNDDHSKTTLALLEKALLVNPDPLNLWNHRREVLLLQLSSSKEEEEEEEDDSNSRSSKASLLLETERALTQAALQRNPKA